jgi:hypothetical protein
MILARMMRIWMSISGVVEVGDLMMEEGNGGGEEEEVLLPPLKSVFQCGYVNQTQPGWECMWCGKSFVGRHSTRALHHVMKMTKNDVGVCSAAIPEKYLK